MRDTVAKRARAGAQRVDAFDKVRGATRYAADHSPAGLLHAALVPARISSGNIRRIDTAAAMRVPGVRLVLTHLNVGSVPAAAPGFPPFQPLRSAEIRYRGQTVALVVAESLEVAREAASLVEVDCETLPSVAALHSEGRVSVPQSSLIPVPAFADRRIGDPDTAYEASTVKIDATYELPRQHHNPIELIATVASWAGDMLTLQEPTQNAEGVRHGVARLLGVDPVKVRVASPTLGGSFGQKNRLQPHTFLVAHAARVLDRPVKLVVPRTQLFHVASFRAASRQRIRLGAQSGGRIVAAIHEVEQQTSRYEVYPSMAAEVTGRMYGIPNFRNADRLVQTHTQTPGPMRAPSEQPAGFAFETAMDELAVALQVDPVALRLMNDTAIDPLSGRPFSSRYVASCLQQGAKAFGWDRRKAEPGSMRAPDGSLVGMGVALGGYMAFVAPAIATVRIDRSGQVRVSVGVHEMGQGIRTAIAVTINRVLGAPIAAIDIQIGDTAVAPQHLTAGSWGTATALPAVADAAAKLLAKLREKAPGVAGHPVALLQASGETSMEAESRHQAQGQPAQAFERLRGGLYAGGGPVYPDFVAMSFVAHFVEVRVEPTTRRVRVHRTLSVVDCGRVISPRTARSQLEGGVIWGIGAALREVAEVDPRYGGCLNADIADYVIPVAADIGRVDTHFINEPDPQLNALGAKGLGEIAMVGVSPAIGNAVFHATGKRLRRLPIRAEDLF